MKRSFLLFAVWLMGTPVPASAAAPAVPAGCVRPPPPACAVGQVAFSDRAALTACHREVEAYLVRIVAYLECQAAEHAAATREMQETVRLFNCRLAGTVPCPPQPSQ